MIFYIQLKEERELFKAQPGSIWMPEGNGNYRNKDTDEVAGERHLYNMSGAVEQRFVVNFTPHYRPVSLEEVLGTLQK